MEPLASRRFDIKKQVDSLVPFLTKMFFPHFFFFFDTGLLCGFGACPGTCSC